MSTSVDALLRALELEDELRRYEAFKFWEPYPSQRQFLDLSKTHYEILLSAGNGTGKTMCGAYAAAVHLTGEYPSWWQGRRWTRPVEAWCCGLNLAILREGAQKNLFGGPYGTDAWGSGMIPRRSIESHTNARAAPEALDSVMVRHVTGGLSRLGFKTYEQAWNGPRLDFIWCDEEPDLEHYNEGLARLTGRDGLMLLTFTPERGHTQVVKRFVDEDVATRVRLEMSMDEVTHIGPDEKARKWLEYSPHVREAKYHGRISAGAGAVFRVPEADLVEHLDLARVPLEWAKLWGVDFGIGHPFAAVLLAWDRERDVIYLLAEVEMRDATPLQHAAAMRRIAGEVPVAWPHDGHVREKGSGDTLAGIYKREGLKMLPWHATHAKGGNSFYAGIEEMHALMQARRWKVNASCRRWLANYRAYHFLDGQIVKLDDDVLDASRYAYMMRRFAKAVPLGPILWTPDGSPKRIGGAAPNPAPAWGEFDWNWFHNRAG